MAGVNPARLLSGFSWPEFQWRRGELAAQLKGKTVLIGADDMDVFKGIELRLQAFERVLSNHPEWRGTLVLVQVGGAALTPELNSAALHYSLGLINAGN